MFMGMETESKKTHRWDTWVLPLTAINHKKRGTLGGKTHIFWRHGEFNIYMRNSSEGVQKIVGTKGSSKERTRIRI